MSLFLIDCVERATETSSHSSPPTAPSTPGTSLLDYEGVIDALAAMPDEEFHPYPTCTIRQLRQVHTFFVAYAHDKDCPQKTADSSPPRTLCGLIGVAWVPLSSSASVSASSLPPVEGYLQVVLVRRSWRKRGVAGALLQACLSAYGDDKPASPSPRFRPSTTLTDKSSVARNVARWRLHTMSPTPATLRCLQTHLGTPPGGSVSQPPSTTSQPTVVPDASPPRQRAEADEKSQWKAAMHAVTAFYEQNGFAVRRQLSRYYADEADAVEMVRTEKDPRSPARTGAPTLLPQKRSRSPGES